jgi:L-asparaginase II
MSRYVPLIDVVRGDVEESQHSGAIVVLNSRGEIAGSLGDVAVHMYPRSTVKLIQTAAMVDAGLDLEPRLLALVASSHSGGDVHVQGVQEIRAKFGIEKSSMKCTPFLPLGEAEKKAYLRTGGGPDCERADCSGKHAGFLATCIINGWSIDNYLDVDHPLQKLIAAKIADATGDVPSNVTVDGCGAPLWTISLTGLARSYHRATTEKESSLHRVADAMRTFPEMVGGPGREATVAMQAVVGAVAKDGADGVFVLSTEDGRAVAYKIGDGGRRGLTAACHAVLEALGGTGLDRLPLNPPQGAGRTVGALNPTPALAQLLSAWR